MIVGRLKEMHERIDYPYLGISERDEVVLFLDREGNGICLSSWDDITRQKIVGWDTRKFVPFRGKIEIENKER